MFNVLLCLQNYYLYMEIIIKVAQLLLSLSILVVLHELGHFIPAKLFKTKVEKFYLFFDWPFSLFKKKIGDTEYGIGALPLGGYVKISGMIDESMDTEQMSKPVQPWEFRSKPSWQRLIIMLGGVTVNFILALVIYIGLSYSVGDKLIINDSVKGGYLITNPILLEAGLKTGDKIISVNNIPMTANGKQDLEKLLIENSLELNLNHKLAEPPSINFNETFRKWIDIPEALKEILNGIHIKEYGLILLTKTKILFSSSQG